MQCEVRIFSMFHTPHIFIAVVISEMILTRTYHTEHISYIKQRLQPSEEARCDEQLIVLCLLFGSSSSLPASLLVVEQQHTILRIVLHLLVRILFLAPPLLLGKKACPACMYVCMYHAPSQGRENIFAVLLYSSTRERGDEQRLPCIRPDI